MWARVVEFMLGCWLAISPFVFHHGDNWLRWAIDWVAAVLVVLFAVLSYWTPMRRAHLGTIVVAVLLLIAGRFVGTGPPDPARQNEIVLALLLVMFAIVPSRASEPPHSWYLTFRDRAEQV